MANDLVSVWGGVPRIGRAPENNELLIGNGSGFTLQTVAITLDNILGSTQGSIAYRSATQWTSLIPGTASNVLQTNGASNNPTWVTPETVVNNALGGSNGALAYKSSGDWGALAIGASTNILASNGVGPGWISISNLFDVYFAGSGVGSIIARDRNAPNGSGLWSSVTIGSNYTLLSSVPGTGGNLPLWSSINDIFDNVFTTSRQAIITRGASNWGFLVPTTTANLLLTNNSGSASSDIGWTTITGAISNGTAGATFQGDILYFGASALQKLNIGTLGYILGSNGTTPQWVNSWQTVYRTNSQNITSTSLVDDNILQVSLANGNSILVEGVIIYSLGTGGAKLAVNGPASSLQFSVSGAAASAVTVNTVFFSTTSSGLNITVSFVGIFQSNATGSFVIRHGLDSASGTTIVQAGSWIRYYKV